MTGYLCNLKENSVEEKLEDEMIEELPEDSNDTNEDELFYFSHIKNHYLCLVKSSGCDNNSRHPMKFPIIADSGANHHMFKGREFFSKITPMQGQVILGDGKTKLQIQGIGTVRCLIGDYQLMIENVCYVPDLAESIYSLFLHIKQPYHGLNSSFEGGLHFFSYFLNQSCCGSRRCLPGRHSSF